MPPQISREQVAAIIPARYASSRFPGKAIVDIAGRPMIQWVYERTRRAAGVGRVLVATDDTRILRVVEGFGGTAVMTAANHASGTDRLAEVAATLDVELIVNVQGDEPLIEPSAIDAAIAPFAEEATLVMSTLCCPISTLDELFDINITKVVTDFQGFALYFSKAPIPYHRDGWGPITSMVARLRLAGGTPPVVGWRHIGLYVYRRTFLLDFARLPQTSLERLEQLEQLRALEHGYRIKVVPTQYVSIGVDTPEDVVKVGRLLRGER
ncbi:MAG TPA: 3-deoxy-manno-octulosonate cytidylyltransferase [Candidatus Tectomicrobia bacterium]|nr:3-deoxy-manno-octulosonate cytidylyltransferase [Candidatus Tectomicrobia bacterium]